MLENIAKIVYNTYLQITDWIEINSQRRNYEIRLFI